MENLKHQPGQTIIDHRFDSARCFAPLFSNFYWV